ncbi:ABC transporter ATP-binding protein [Saccharibacillus brassicae]|uniref:ABC transporter ATP-binding protein n=1 Tax=Saccharibacillus brassicae TaxID=2583377 RepID=A0A4Y6UYF3_SACBS|nr:ABC transporter ATP-binding protein [Saccharibacillus brassicae]QDH21247.1 ABC transporter ATP-binding protein [Saccharibacillus brassicae]
MAKELVAFRNLETHFKTSAGTVKAVNDVSFSIREGETLCVVGESGCGKSVTAMSLMQLIESPPGKIVGGEILFEGKDLLKLSKKEMSRLRGNDIAMIFQEPMSSLNPVFTIGKQISEPLLHHLTMSHKEAKARAIELITMVGIPRPEKIYDSYPHELSGGMRQRIMIAIALSCNPKLLIADEPTTALDVTIQAQILDLMRDIKGKMNTAIMMITHDLGVVAEMADFVVVMYAGKVIEEASVLELFREPKHPYTQGLLKAKPIINQRQERLYSIPGQVPNPVDLGDNCHFHDRCEFCMEICKVKTPPLRAHADGHKTACWLYEEEGQRNERNAGSVEARA